MAPASGGTNKSAKEVFDEIGKTIQEQAKRDAEKRSKGKLQGDLSKVQFTNGEKTGVRNPCDLHHEFETNATTGNSDPCLNKSAVRFSDTEGAQCYFYKIKNSDSTIGFCAPYRRLHLCVKNLEQIRPDQITSTHNLLSDVLLAAKHEGQSLVEQCEEHKKKNSDFNICTALARSFADLGDIIRGKDLYLGHKLGNNRLEDRLKTIFENIGNKNNAPLDKISIEQVREYWWALNRDQVWKAITCKAKEDNIYSRTAGDTTLWNDNCGHKDEHVPTYLDYVPQYLRWFDEWSEDFCRKRNHKLKLAKDACRNDKEEKYCSLNGYDCTKPIRKEDSCSRENKCTACSNECNPYQLWLEKQQNEFKIQKVKYDKEIERYVDKKDIFNDNINTEYYKNFYQELINTYKNHKDFLKLLNEGMYCKKGVEGESPINFNETGDKDAFDRSKYCQRCPDCIVVCKGERCEENKTDVGNCRSKIIKEILKSEEGTEIDVLYSGKGRGLITEKLKDFCMEPNNYQGTNVEKWNCYNKNNDYNKCEMISWLYQDPKESNLMLSIQCFDSWAQNLLIDTIRWEHQLKDCINNTNVTDCESKCNNNCKCYEAWINRKEDEWKKLKDVLKKKDKNSHNYYNKLSTVFDSFLYPVLDALKKEDKDGKWDQFRKDLEKKFKSPKKNTDTADSEDAIQLLLDHLKDNAITCRDNNSLEGGQKCPQAKNNPCIRNPNNSNKPPKSVKHIAETMQRRARKQLEEEGVGEIILKGDATRGEYRSSGSEKKLEKICDITLEHSNRNERNSQGPCYNKDGGGTMFELKDGWKPGSAIGMTDQYAYMPPRRQHFCTSNLEYLETDDKPLNQKDGKLVNDSFLGDVLLSANKQVEWIKKKYKDQRHLNDNETMCRAVKYSFADLGDIIKGTDLWGENQGEKKIQGTLIKIFGTLYNSLSKDIPEKYPGDEDKKPPYKQLREDWWEANRHQVWRAMKCAIKKNNIETCKGIPIEDYIPQRLRWMTELAEWYVKFQSEEKKPCNRRVIKSIRVRNNYTEDSTKCNKYKEELKSWKEQWTKLGKKYSTLYGTAKVNAFKDDTDKSTFSVDEKDQPVYDFLLDLHLQNGGKVGSLGTTQDEDSEAAPTSIDTPYDNAGAYVHDMVDLSDCKGQIDFCNRGIKYKPPSADQPSIDPSEEDPPAPEGDDKVCGMVKEFIRTNNVNGSISQCHKKSYNDWSCKQSDVDPDHAGACMPPRREKLCIYFLKILNNNDKTKLKDAFIKCTAAETFLLWQNYKKDEKSKVNNLDNTLKHGVIPDDFKRQMFYTFGDYRDLCLGTDISAGNKLISAVKNNIDKCFNKKGDKGINGNTERKKWWDEIKKDVWKGMLCALEKFGADKDELIKKYDYETVKFSGNNSPTLDKFAENLQFLRWFTEWSDDFCNQQEKEINKLQDKCNLFKCEEANVDQKRQCQQQCNKYRKFVTKSKDQYKTQNIKYEGLRYTNDIIKDKTAPEYFKDKDLCIKDADYTYYNMSFEYPPENFKEKCNCPLSDTNETEDTNKTSKPKKEDDTYEDFEKCPFENSDNSGDTTVVNKERCKKLDVQRSCIKTYENNLDQWNGSFVKDVSGENKGVLMPPRRKNLCRTPFMKTFYYSKDIDKFRNDFYTATFNQGILLGKIFKDYKHDKTVHKALKNSFADYADIIKGKDMMEGANIEDFNKGLKKMFPENNENTRTSTVSRDEWWTTNKHKVWNSMLCGYHKGITEPPTPKKNKRKSPPTTVQPKTTNIPSSWCDMPKEDETSQFLRWLREWGTQYCKEKEQLKSIILLQCKSHLDKYGIIEKKDDINPNCLPSLEKYEVWSNKRLPEWDGLSKKYKKDKDNNKYSSVQEKSADTYLKQNCSECKCSFKDIEQTHKKSEKGGYDIYVDILDKAEIPSFLEDTAYRYKGPKPECPNINECKEYGNVPCKGLPHDDDNDWNSSFVKDNKKKNTGVLLPPRRKHLCLRIEQKNFDYLRNQIKNFKNFICSSALAEVKRLKQIYKDDSKLLEAMKYSFADIGNVVKGDDMMESRTSEFIDKIFKGKKYTETNRKKWWNENKYHVWESMLCAYKDAKEHTENNENCRFPDIERVPQFLRWFQEWTKIFCIKRKTLYDKMVTECQNSECDTSNGTVNDTKCTKACEEYKYYVLSKKKEYDIQQDKYNKEFKKILNYKDAPNYLKIPCLSEYFNEKNKWENPYESINDSKLKGKCDCKKKIPLTPLVKPKKPAVPKEKIPEVPPLNPEVEPLPADEPFNRNILEKTIPFGVALALGSIAFLFLKKKTQSPVDLFSVINIPKGDYDIPTLKSTNRYIPYGSDRYKGKTYIYMEGDSSGDEKYAFISDTTDVTSSESEYEELDINDIYVPGSPKYKTLIEVVLEPSKRDIPSDDIPSSDTPINKFTDEEWNQLKHDFISNMLQNQPKDVPNDYKSGNVPLNTQPNTLYFDKPEEKPFITSIHDRNLYSGEEYSYNVNMVNNNDIPINRDNNVYSGIDLINDSLNNNNVDIYDELLKRKENELFGTNHPKHTNTHSVTKSSNSDPIDNQLDLFHTWLDRHRDMCEKWNNKEEVLDKLKEEWNKDNNSGDIHTSDSNNMLNTDVSIQIHMDNPKPINQFTNMDTILEDLEKYNEPYYDVQDDIYYDVHDHDTPTVDSNNMDVPSKVQIEMDVNTKLVKEKYPIADVWDI
ncbi:erythrocyte membrane protein 1, PfEMP1, putative [Plasmodium sp.]|nr:erythrocyte membrane protein 1, PfEMP1, putative [Plasmodium sp.]